MKNLFFTLTFMLLGSLVLGNNDSQLFNGNPIKINSNENELSKSNLQIEIPESPSEPERFWGTEIHYDQDGNTRACYYVMWVAVSCTPWSDEGPNDFEIAD